MTLPYNAQFWIIILAPSSPPRDVTMHRVLQNFYDKTHSEEPLMLRLDKETELTAANV